MDEAMTTAAAPGVQGDPPTSNRGQGEIAPLALRARKAWAVLLERFGGDGALTEPQIDYVFARFVLGLTAVFYRTAPAKDHLAVYRCVLIGCIGSIRTEAALRCSPPDLPPPWTDETVDSVERLGRAEGLRMQTPDFDEKKEPAHRLSAAEAQQTAGYHASPSTDIDRRSSQGVSHV